MGNNNNISETVLDRDVVAMDD